MKLTILALGRAKPSPEALLTADYVKRIDATGRALGLGPLSLIELDAKGKGREAESALILEKVPPGSVFVALDERGKAEPSVDFAYRLARVRDEGAPEMVFAIGGADGHTQAVRDRADRLLAFGPATWPHMLVRAMLAEQIFRGVSILAGHPYHRA